MTLAHPDVPQGTIGIHSPKGNPATIFYREDTSDLATLGSTWNLWDKLDDEYGLASLPTMSGLAIDIGAHIGSVALALLADHPDLHVVAVEPLAENADLIARSAEYNGWSDRLTIHTAAIAKGRTVEVAYDFRGDDYIRNHRFIGDMGLGRAGEHSIAKVPALTLSKLMGKQSCVFLKTDCEGCEWDLLADPAIKRVAHIVGEGHPFDWLSRVHALLDATHDVSVIEDRGGPGTFRAVRR